MAPHTTHLPRLLALAIVLAGCATRPAAPVTPEAQPEIITPPTPDALLDTTPLRARPAVRPLPITNAFRSAVTAGTRTLDGRPGPNYWQQRTRYRIDAELNPRTARLDGVQTVTYWNASPDTLRQLVLHLHQNLFAPGVERVRPVPVTGGMTIERVSVGGRTLRAGNASTTGEAFRVAGTLMTVTLPRPLPPGGQVDAEIAWHFTVPPAGAPRMGHDRREVYTVAQWFPQVGVYDDIHGWAARPYWGNAEFYLGYGDFDVSITVPEGWLVAATGTLQNPEEVLTDEARGRLAAALAADGITRVITNDEIEAGDATQRLPGGQLTWRFAASDVRDFAFATSNRYLWDAARAVLPDANGDGRPEHVAVHALYRPEATLWREAARYARHSLTYHAERWHPYPYPQMTTAEGPVGGMEYPMITFISGPRASAQDLYRVTSHEIAHQWFPMMVGSDESRHMWQDEGMVVWMQDHSVRAFFPESQPFAETQLGYLSLAGDDGERPIMREGDLYGIGPQYVVAAYRKPGTLWRSLGRIIGEETLDQAIRDYARRWIFRHPTPFDLFHTIEDVAGRDLSWFWTPWFYDTVVLDQAIVSVAVEEIVGTPAASGASEVEVLAAGARRAERVTVVVEDFGGAPMPVELELTMADGRARRVMLPVEPWLEGRTRQWATVELESPVVRVVIDPDRVFPDVDRNNNTWVRPQ
jgi:hypothetical protein